MKSRFNTARFRNKTVGSSLVTAIVVCFSGSAMAQTDITWNGSVSTEWNDGANWDGGEVPTKAPDDENAVINTTTPNIATITVGIIAPRDINIGSGATGQLDHPSGEASTGSSNWMRVGTDGGIGTYNLADTAGTGGTLTGFGTGTGSMNVNAADLFIGGDLGTGSTGTVNVNTSGLLTIGGRLQIGTSTSAGTLNIDNGTVTTNNWTEIGNGAGSTGTLNMSGGALNKTGGEHLIVGANGATGIANITGGSIDINNEIWVANNGGSNGTLNLSGGTIHNNSWVAIGRSGAALGTVNMTGGSWDKTGGGNFLIGTGGTGVMEQSDGTVTSTNSIIVGEGTTGTLTLSGGSMTSSGQFFVGQGGGTGTLNLSGAGSITSQEWFVVGRENGNGTVNMTGGTITKGATDSNFIIGSGGTSVGVFNMSAGLVTVPAAGPGDRGITWIGEFGDGQGTLNLSGSARFNTESFVLGSSDNAIGTINFDGGEVETAHILGGNGTATVNFNGTQITATTGSNDFINNLDTATIDAGGLLVDSNGFNLGVPQPLAGTGGIVKTGGGNLNLSAANSYAGATTINGGSVSLTTKSTATGAITLADATGLGVTQIDLDEVYSTTGATFGTAGDTTLDFDLGDLDGNTLNAPLDISGTTTVNGVVTVNIADTWPIVGTIPLVSYAGPKNGGGSFALGTLPNGVVATLGDNGTSLVSLDVTRVSAPVWDGYESDVWDIATTENWIDSYSGDTTTYEDPDPVMFNDDAYSIDVVLNSTVQPGGSGVTIDASNSSNYTFTGTGKISGTAGLLKANTGTATMSLINDYTGVTTLTGGTLNVASLTNGGVASGIGAATNDPANLVFGGGTLAYTGAATTTDRGFTITGNNSGISTGNDLAISGLVNSTGGNFTKTGAGNLTFITDGDNTFGTVNPGINLLEGKITFDGTGVTQTNSVAEEFFIGMMPDTDAHLVVLNSELNVGFWLGLGRGNGTTGSVNSFTATNSTINTGNFGFGYRDTIPEADYNAVQVATLTDTTMTTGQTWLGESGGSNATLTLNDSSFTGGGFGGGRYTGSAGALNVNGSSVMNLDGTVHIGVDGTGELNLTGTSEFNGAGWITLGRYGAGVGTANVSSGSLNQDGVDQALIVGEDGIGTLNVSGTGLVTADGAQILIAPNASSTGTVNLDGGTIIARRIGGGGEAGNGAFNFNGGLLQAGTDANTDFISGIDTTNVLAGGANIDSNGQTIAVNQALLDGTGGGGLTKTGAGFLQLNATNTYTGTTTVSAGSLGGTGSVAGPLLVDAAASIAPGASVGTFSAGDTTIAGAYACEIDGSAADLLVAGALDVSAATLAITELTPASGATVVIATYTGAEPAPFLSVTGMPVDYTIDYNYGGNNEIALVGSGTGYDIWASDSGLTPANNGATQDPEFDGIENSLEFVLSGDPLASDTEILPTLDASGTDFVFSFTRADESEDEISLLFQYGTDLIGWTDVVIGADDAGSGPEVSIIENADDPDDITVTVPKGANTELFGRLNAVK